MLIGPLTFNSFSSYAQCPSGNIFLDSQQAINNFGLLYPNCEHPEGDVYITGQDIWSLQPLGTITEIEGSLELNNLGFINTLSELNVVHIGNEFRVTDNLLMSHLQGMDQLQTIGGDLFVFNNPSLNTLNGMTALQSVNNIQLLDNHGLFDISQLGQLSSINGFVYFINMSGLSDLSGLESVSTIHGDLRFENTGIVNLTGLNDLMTIQGSVYFIGNDSLESMAGYPFSEIAGDLVIKNNQDLTNIHDMLISTSISDSLIIQNNNSLSDCDALTVCHHITVNGDHRIEDNADGCLSNEQVDTDCQFNSLDEFALELLIAPNPARDIVSIRSNIPSRTAVIDMQGREVLRGHTSQSMDVSNLSEGMYLMRFLDLEYQDQRILITH